MYVDPALKWHRNERSANMVEAGIFKWGICLWSCFFFFPMMTGWWGSSSGKVSLTKPQLGDGEGRTHRRRWMHYRGTLLKSSSEKKRIPQTADRKLLWFRLRSFCDPTICSRVINHLCTEAPAFHNALNKGAKTDTTVHFRLCKSRCLCYIYIFASTPPSIFVLHMFFYTWTPLVN